MRRFGLTLLAALNVMSSRYRAVSANEKVVEENPQVDQQVRPCQLLSYVVVTAKLDKYIRRHFIDLP